MAESLSKRDHLLKLVEGFDNGMFATKTPDGNIHGRPMSIVKVGDAGEVYLNSGAQDPKIEELERDPRAALLMQGKMTWVALQGTVQVSRDRKLIDELWREDWKVWYPAGKDDPTLRILIFDTHSGEYWDNTSHRGLRFAFEAATAYIEGREAGMVADQNAKVKL